MPHHHVKNPQARGQLQPLVSDFVVAFVISLGASCELTYHREQSMQDPNDTVSPSREQSCTARLQGKPTSRLKIGHRSLYMTCRSGRSDRHPLLRRSTLSFSCPSFYSVVGGNEAIKYIEPHSHFAKLDCHTLDSDRPNENSFQAISTIFGFSQTISSSPSSQFRTIAATCFAILPSYWLFSLL